jgi:polyhydroxyalkanoate synthesis repressor PhaR
MPRREGLSLSPSPPLPAERAVVRLIKKYPNRKFYDTVDKRYVSLFGISTLVRDGEEVQVVETKTGDDITSLVLAQVLRDQQRRGTLLPRSLLAALVTRGAGGLKQLRNPLQTSVRALQALEDDVHGRIDTLASRGEITLAEAQEWREELAAGARDRQAAAEERIIQEIQDSLVRLDVPTEAELTGLGRQLGQIEAKVDSLLRDQGLAE